MSQLDGVFLDFYGTLASGDCQVVEAVCQAVIDDHGLETDGAEMAARWGDGYFAAIEAVDGTAFRRLCEIEGDTLVETARQYGCRIDPQPYIDRLNAYLAQPTLFEEVQEVLAALDVPACIVSNADEREIRSAIRHHRLPLDYVVTSESARSYKPEPRIFEQALELTGWSPERVVHVGDSLHSDVAGAHRAGIRAAWVNRAERIRDIGTEQADLTWTDLKPLLSL